MKKRKIIMLSIGITLIVITFIASIIWLIYKNAVFDTTEKSLLRHISAEKGLK